MKKIFIFLIISVATYSCYDDYVNDFDYSSVYFTYQTDVRTFVVGEGMSIKIGVALGGVMENNINRSVGFTFDEDLVTPEMLTTMKSGTPYIKDAVKDVTNLLPIPASHFTLSDNSNMIIKPGYHSGYVIMRADSVNFLSDPATLQANYVIPLRITSANDIDTVIKSKEYTVIGLKYENMLFGNYWHGGVTTIKDASGNTINTVRYKTVIPSPDAKTWALKTVAPNALTVNGYSDVKTNKPEIMLTLNGGSIIINSVAGADKEILPDGASTFNQAKLLQDRKIILSYKYDNGDGTTSYAQDTLTFRNRIRDGVNEWQDENPSLY